LTKARINASLVRRLAALAYELLLLAALLLSLGFVLLPVFGPASPPGGRALGLLAPAARAGSFALIVAACGAYSVWLWTGGRRTLPMKTWHLALVGSDGESVRLGPALVRYTACWIGPACAIVAYLALKPGGHAAWSLVALAVNHAWALIDRDRQFLHDRIAGTRLVDWKAAR
jgi:uncharacterized RDD family membrane protein YckC